MKTAITSLAGSSMKRSGATTLSRQQPPSQATEQQDPALMLASNQQSASFGGKVNSAAGMASKASGVGKSRPGGVLASGKLDDHHRDGSISGELSRPKLPKKECDVMTDRRRKKQENATIIRAIDNGNIIVHEKQGP